MNNEIPFAGDVRDLNSLVLGKHLGTGIARNVYECNLNKEYVVKVEERDSSGMFQNVAEWMIWQAAAYDEEFALWLAPCIQISNCGIYLLQQRVQQPLTREQLPARVPTWMCDLKVTNFGLYEDRVVACDYGTLISMFPSYLSRRMKKPDWWSESGGWISS